MADAPPPPPPPPPGPPPPVKVNNTPARPAADVTDLLADIRGGAKLKKVPDSQKKDRSEVQVSTPSGSTAGDISTSTSRAPQSSPMAMMPSGNAMMDELKNRQLKKTSSSSPSTPTSQPKPSTPQQTDFRGQLKTSSTTASEVKTVPEQKTEVNFKANLKSAPVSTAATTTPKESSITKPVLSPVTKEETKPKETTTAPVLKPVPPKEPTTSTSAKPVASITPREQPKPTITKPTSTPRQEPSELKPVVPPKEESIPPLSQKALPPPPSQSTAPKPSTSTTAARPPPVPPKSEDLTQPIKKEEPNAHVRVKSVSTISSGTTSKVESKPSTHVKSESSIPSQSTPAKPPPPKPTTPTSSSGGASQFTIHDLEKLKSQLDRGILTQQEFDALKRKILGL